MQTFTRGIYLVFGVGLLLAAAAALIRPGLIIPPEEVSPLVAHLVREQAAGFVFIGLMFLWCWRHFDARRPVHLALVLFAAIFAGIHWMSAFHGYWHPRVLIVNTTPFALFAITAPWKRG